jgi:phage tail P2-like protein
MNTTIKNVDMLLLLPFFMRGDEASAALSRAVNKLVNEPGSRVNQLRVWDMVDDLGHAELDELAWELNIDWYNHEMSIEAKRLTIKAAPRIQERRGTKWAVEAAIGAVYPRSTVEEWWEYGGEPFHFRVILDISRGHDLPDIPQIKREIEMYKRLSTRLDEIVIRTNTWGDMLRMKWDELRHLTWRDIERGGGFLNE